MARLPKGEKERRGNLILRLLRACFGLRESEIAKRVDWDRRTVNNYLHELDERGDAYKEGRSWFADE